MTADPALLAAVAADPDADAPRLVYADFLDDRGEHARAELIRVQCTLEPVRDRYDLPDAAALHAREDELLDDLRPDDAEWLTGLFGHDASYPYSPLLYRRGFVHQVRLPAPAWVEHGAAVRERCPLVRSLRVHRLNGWGDRLARCESLAGLTELDLACWYDWTDARAVVLSRHCRRVRTVRLWAGHRADAVHKPLLFTGWPAIRELRLVDMTCGGRVSDAAKYYVRPRAQKFRLVVEDRSGWLFPLAADSHGYVGRLGDGRLFLGVAGDPRTAAAVRGLTFAPDGTPGDRLDIALPAETRRSEVQRVVRERLHDRLGFEPAFIRVVPFRLDGFGPLEWWPAAECPGFGEPDDPADWPPRNRLDFHGNGAVAARKWDDRCYTLGTGTDPWCDKTGRVQTI